MAVRRLALIVLVLIVFLLSVVACAPRSPRVHAGVLDLRGSRYLQNDVLRLDGEWGFFWKEFIFEGETPSRPDAAPRFELVPNSWTEYQRNGVALPASGFASYRLKVLLDRPMDEMAFHIRDASLAYRLYLNGRLILQEGNPERTAGAKDRMQMRKISGPVNLKTENEIVLEVANFEYHESGLRKSVRLGQHRLLDRERSMSIGITTLLLGALAFMALYHLILFGFERREVAALSYAGLSVAMIARIALTNERLLLLVWPVDFSVFIKLLTFMTYAILPTLALLVYNLFPQIVSRLHVNLSLVGAGILTCIVLFFEPIVFMKTVPIFGVLITYLGIYGIFVIGKAVHARIPDAGIFLAAFCWFLPFMINDTLYTQGIVQTGYYAQYGFSALVLSQAFTVSRRILRSRRLSEKLAEDLERSNERLRSMDRVKDEFLARTSHELRTPLQGIIGMTDALHEDVMKGASERIPRHLDFIRSSGRRLSGLVNNILDFTRMRNGDIRLQARPIDLYAFAGLQLELIAYNIPGENSVQLLNEVPRDLPRILGDEARLTQVFQNLLGNALQVLDRGTIRITAEVSEDETRAMVHVIDDGPGIPGDQLTRIFQPFEQGETGTGAVGLGLTIARSLIELHAGTMSVSSTPNKGTRFSFSLPVTEQVVAENQPNESNVFGTWLPARLRPYASEKLSISGVKFESASKILPERMSSSPLNAPRVLLVDDEDLNLEVMRLHLEKASMIPILARDATTAREVLSEDRKPDCVVLDVMLPEVSGLDLAREIRESHALSEVPILIVTALARTGDLIAALDAGANDYLAKPFEQEEFLFRVRNLTNLAGTHRGRRHTAREAAREGARQERARINADLHDHLGASLTDLHILSKAALDNTEVQPAFAKRLHAMVLGMKTVLRNELLHLEDLELLEKNFFDGMQMILLRRYLEAERTLGFVPPEDNEILQAGQAGEIVPVLYAVMKEIATNDLKYGTGRSHWNIRAESNGIAPAAHLRIDFASQTDYNLETHGTGQGTAGMLRRLSEIDATLRISIQNENATGAPRPIRIEIKVPLRQPEESATEQDIQYEK